MRHEPVAAKAKSAQNATEAPWDALEVPLLRVEEISGQEDMRQVDAIVGHLGEAICVFRRS